MPDKKGSVAEAIAHLFSGAHGIEECKSCFANSNHQV
jgi:hypothetical protein